MTETNSFENVTDQWQKFDVRIKTRAFGACRPKVVTRRAKVTED